MDDLIQQKKDLEEKLDDLYNVLKSHNCDMDTPLLTPDGFPRADIDVAQCRITRAEIIRLRNDLSEVMQQIEKQLIVHFQNSNQQQESNSKGSTNTDKLAIPFAKINTVNENSTASEAGLKPGDLLVQFGNANITNHAKLSKLASELKNNDVIDILVKREGNVVDLKLKGRGSLGCHVLPLS